MTKANPHPDDGFYEALPSFHDFSEVIDDRHYQPAPDSWFVVVTDVVGSTDAIEQGRYKEVNTAGVATIVTAIHAAGDRAIPYVFGGDGATLLVPPAAIDAVRTAMQELSQTTKAVFDLGLRVGVFPVRELRARGADVRVARFRASRHVSLAMFGGTGIDLAERLLKDPMDGESFRVKFAADGTKTASPSALRGLSCRWEPVPTRRGAMVSLLVSPTSTEPSQRGSTVRRVLAELDALASESSGHLQPTSLETIEPSRNPAAYVAESRILTGQRSGFRQSLFALIGRMRIFFFNRLPAPLLRLAIGVDASTYRQQLVANTDYRKYDGTLRMVVDLDEHQRTELERFLERERARGTLCYGLHVSQSALLTCFVTDYAGDHVHFVDGSDGGYALAAKMLKRQRAA